MSIYKLSLASWVALLSLALVVSCGDEEKTEKTEAEKKEDCEKNATKVWKDGDCVNKETTPNLDPDADKAATLTYNATAGKFTYTHAEELKEAPDALKDGGKVTLFFGTKREPATVVADKKTVTLTGGALKLSGTGSVYVALKALKAAETKNTAKVEFACGTHATKPTKDLVALEGGALGYLLAQYFDGTNKKLEGFAAADAEKFKTFVTALQNKCKAAAS